MIENGKVALKTVVSNIQGHQVTFSDGSSEHVDVLIYASGYLYTFPFCPELTANVAENYVEDFYKTVFWLRNPRLAFVGGLTAA